MRESTEARNVSRSFGWADAGTRSIRRYAVPMAFASSTICARRVSKRDKAPEKVNAIINPRRAKTAVSSEPRAGAAEGPYRAMVRLPIRSEEHTSELQSRFG